MKYSSRFFLYAPVGVFLILFAVAGVRWWMLASAWSQRLDAMNGHEIMPGVRLLFTGKHITGFPFTLETQFDNLALEVATPHGTTGWISEKFAIHGLTYGRDEVIFEAAGHQQLDWAGADGARHRLNFAVGSLRASAIHNTGELVRFDVDLIGFGSKAFTAQRLQFHARKDGNAILIFDEADNIFTRRSCIKDAHLRYAASLSNADALGPLLDGRVSYAQGVQAWRAGGGTITAAKPSPFAVPVETLLEIDPLARAVCP